jgi:hypothetical protein
VHEHISKDRRVGGVWTSADEADDSLDPWTNGVRFMAKRGGAPPPPRSSSKTETPGAVPAREGSGGTVFGSALLFVRLLTARLAPTSVWLWCVVHHLLRGRELRRKQRPLRDLDEGTGAARGANNRETSVGFHPIEAAGNT